MKMCPLGSHKEEDDPKTNVTKQNTFTSQGVQKAHQPNILTNGMESYIHPLKSCITLF
jgi:hypothetical protein